jgi:hypothetical protein
LALSYENCLNSHEQIWVLNLREKLSFSVSLLFEKEIFFPFKIDKCIFSSDCLSFKPSEILLAAGGNFAPVKEEDDEYDLAIKERKKASGGQK